MNLKISVIFSLGLLLSCKTSSIQKSTPSPIESNDTYDTDEPMGNLEDIPEYMPMFSGCFAPEKTTKENHICAQTLMLEFIEKNKIYPQAALKNKTEGTVVINFSIEKDGSITNAKILRDIGNQCGEEAKRIVEAMPNWIPGKQRGQNVVVSFNLPIRFSTDEKN